MNYPTHQLLESDPVHYFKIVSNLNEFPEVNDTCYETWYSNHIQSLSYLVGTKVNNYEDDYYGSKLDNLDEDLGIKILHELIRLGGDLYMENYYGCDTLKELNREDNSFKRINNENFIEAVEKYYNEQLENN